MSSFVKKINTAPQLYKSHKGVKTFSNQQYGVSSGTPSLDAVLPGNALPLGTLCVLYEDTFSRHYVHLHKSYLGEGIVNEHKCLVIDPDTFSSKDDWLKLLPAVYKVSSSTPSEAA